MKLAGVPAHPDLIRVADHYELLANGRAIPRRTDFYPTQFGWMLGRMYLLDVLEGGRDYRFRLFGDFWQTVFGVDLAGMCLSTLEGEGRLVSLRPDYDRIVATGIPMYRPGTVKWANGASFEYERLLLPFANEQGEVCMLLGAATCGMATHDLIFFRGLGFPELVLEERGPAD